MDDIAAQVCRRQMVLEGERQLHERNWMECYDYTFPERGAGLNGTIWNPTDVQSKKVRILDDTAAESVRQLAANMVSSATPANSQWLGFDAGPDHPQEEEKDEESRWLDRAARIIWENIQASDFPNVIYETAIDFVCAGWPVLYVDEYENGGFRFEQWPLGQCFISASRTGGEVDTVYRRVYFTVEQLVNDYGIDNVSRQVAQAHAAKKLDEKVQIIHAIYPRKAYLVGGKKSKNLPFASCHVEVSTKHLLREGGYHEFPCMVPRGALIPGSSYAFGLLSQALGSIRTVNEIKALELAGLDFAANGMYVAEDDGVLNPKSIKIGPRRIIVANSVDSIKELKGGGDFNVTFTAEERLQAAIRKILMSDQLQPADGPAMTATEVHVRVQLIRQALGPMIGRWESSLRALVDRCFGIALRAGILGAPPDSLRGRNFPVKFFSPLARAQRLEEITSMDRIETTMMQEMQVDPTVIDNYDFDEAMRLRHLYLGVPKSTLRTPESRDELRKQRQQVQQEQQQQAMAQGLVAKAGESMIENAA